MQESVGMTGSLQSLNGSDINISAFLDRHKWLSYVRNKGEEAEKLWKIHVYLENKVGYLYVCSCSESGLKLLMFKHSTIFMLLVVMTLTLTAVINVFAMHWFPKVVFKEGCRPPLEVTESLQGAHSKWNKLNFRYFFTLVRKSVLSNDSVVN